ncbi:hypothetical protein [Gimesia chilikensis]|uniref:Uncharacterized protein n=1 Tax=Gimesia chilikensis TaxID=2605989 RepID=A0A517PGG0_9PLAN|nr:hypothetical protein [Gimesia chilikensis]QDT18445.1 hypothetical protein HG66A1_02060 [Gimesia chilikensis]
MDSQEINDWMSFCEHKRSFELDHFSSMFMELYLESLTEKEKSDLETVFSYIPNKSRILDKMFRLDFRADDKTENEITNLVLQDLKEKRRIIDSPSLIQAMDYGVNAIMSDEEKFAEYAGCELNCLFYHDMANYFVQHLSKNDVKFRALSNAFYGLASNAHLQWALTCDLLNLDLSFDNYFELYLIGVDYAISEKGIYVINYRELMGNEWA